jgi:hypothetical protein
MLHNERIYRIAAIIDPAAFRDANIISTFWVQPARERALQKAHQILDFVTGAAVPVNDNVDFPTCRAPLDKTLEK